MKMNMNTYRDKVRACFLGKNIGGTIGMPFEGLRGAVDLDYYTHDLSLGVLPNDDLDLQLVWLSAAEKYGVALNADLLAEYWLTYVTADWSEYGVAKSNLRAGLPVGEANRYKNIHKDSCGCFIRSELWACLAPGRPEIAVKFAFEDGIIDHADDGLWGEIFFAAVQSAAFVENDLRKLIDIGLSYIPADSGMALGIKTALDCYDSGVDWKAARKKILQTVTGAFGLQMGKYINGVEDDIPETGFGYDAPSNVGLTIMSALYAEGDFSKAVCIAAGSGEDADCTAGTVGALMGIIGGTACIDEKWLVPIGDTIKTVSIDTTKPDYTWGYLPTTVSNLTDRIIKLMPTFMRGYFDPEAAEFETNEVLYDVMPREGLYYTRTWRERFEVRNAGVRVENNNLEAVIIPEGEFDIKDGEVKNVKLCFENKLMHNQWVSLRFDFPEDWETNYREVSMPLYENFHNAIFTDKSISFVPHNLTQNRYDIPVVITSTGRLTKTYTKISFFVE